MRVQMPWTSKWRHADIVSKRVERISKNDEVWVGAYHVEIALTCMEGLHVCSCICDEFVVVGVVVTSLLSTTSASPFSLRKTEYFLSQLFISRLLLLSIINFIIVGDLNFTSKESSTSNIPDPTTVTAQRSSISKQCAAGTSSTEEVLCTRQPAPPKRLNRRTFLPRVARKPGRFTILRYLNSLISPRIPLSAHFSS